MPVDAPVGFDGEILTRTLLRRKAIEQRAAERVSKVAYHGDYIGFMRDVLGWYPWTVQEEIIHSVQHNTATYVKKCHASGGTALAARLALAFLFDEADDPDDSCVVLTTAPVSRQIRGQLWPELRNAYKRAKVTLPGKLYYGQLGLFLSDRQFIIGFTADREENVPGFHARRVLLIKDEAAGIDEPIANALESCMAGGVIVRKVEFSQPLRSSGAFYNAFTRNRAQYENALFSISYDRTPNFTGEGDAEGTDYRELITPSWVADKEIEWGRDSAIFGVRVLAEFPPQGMAQLIAPDWCEAARLRNPDGIKGGSMVMAIDVGGMGRAMTVFQPRSGDWLYPAFAVAKQNPMEIAGLAVQCIAKWGVQVVGVDTTGEGAGVYARLRELDLGCEIVSIKAGEKAWPRYQRDYKNLGTQAWAMLAHKLRDNEIGGAIPDNLIADLTQAQAFIQSDGRLKLEKYGDTENSPDYGDAAAYTELLVTREGRRGSGYGARMEAE